MAGKNTTSKVEEAEHLAVKLLKMLGIKAKVESNDQDGLVKINVEGDDLGLLIGHRGETLESLQLLLSVILNKKSDKESWTTVLVDVDGWRQQRESALRAFLSREVAKLRDEKDTIELQPMPPAQRRVVHLLAKEFEGLSSESVDEGPNRRVVIKRVKNDQ
jgi:spoIIIJ-associated protein